MRIVQINTVCGTGSTGRIAVDLYDMAEKAGNECAFVYGRGEAPMRITQSFKTGNKFDFICHVLRNFFEDGSGFGSVVQTQELLRWMEQWKPDIIHLHNIHGFYLQVELLFAYIKKNNLPVVWTFHDCWPFTGHCAHFDYVNCQKWKSGCEQCNYHKKAYPYALFKDNSINNYQRKKTAFCKVNNLTVVTPSKWLKEITKQSFFSEYTIKVIYNGIDTDQFFYCPNTEVGKNLRERYQLKNKKILLGVANVWTQKKGLSFFEEMAQNLSEDYQIVLVGVNEQQRLLLNQRTNGKIIALKRTENIGELATLYSMASVFVNPTLEDNFPSTNLEALACSTPVVTFQTGGSPEALTTECGAIVPKGDLNQLQKKVLEIAAKSDSMREACREQAMQFQKDKQYRKYINLYQQILQGENT